MRWLVLLSSTVGKMEDVFALMASHRQVFNLAKFMNRASIESWAEIDGHSTKAYLKRQTASSHLHPPPAYFLPSPSPLLFPLLSTPPFSRHPISTSPLSVWLGMYCHGNSSRVEICTPRLDFRLASLLGASPPCCWSSIERICLCMLVYTVSFVAHVRHIWKLKISKLFIILLEKYVRKMCWISLKEKLNRSNFHAVPRNIFFHFLWGMSLSFKLVSYCLVYPICLKKKMNKSDHACVHLFTEFYLQILGTKYERK